MYARNEFQLLRGTVSIVALEFICSKLNKEMHLHTQNIKAFECIIRRTHGLPCFYKLALLGNFVEIPLHLIHTHWSRLNIIGMSDEKDASIEQN